MRRVTASRIWMLAALIGAALSLSACEALDHDRGSDSCYCYSDVHGGSSATVSHKWRL